MKQNQRIEVIKKLIEQREKNIRQIAKLLKMDYKNIYLVIKKMEKQGLIKLERFGKALKCKLNKKNNPLLFQAEYERRERVLKNKNLKIICEKLSNLPFSFIALIFGSRVKGKVTRGSDIDLMIICEKNREQQIEDIISLFPFKIHIVILSFEEFLTMAKTKEFNVVNEAIKRNILLIGIEDYYRLIENVE